MSDIIIVDQLSKQFGDFRAVNDLSFSVPTGVVYGFLGQNGAGKSTTIRMLLTLIRPSSGSIRIFGSDLHAERRKILSRIGAIIEKPDLYLYLTAYQNLELMARLGGLSKTKAELLAQLERVGIADRSNSKVETFSQGMKQRLGIACALVNDPALIILDEPVNGLDPQGIADIRNLILHLSREEGKTVFLSSHLLSEMELVADHMLIIDRGRKVAEGKVNDLLNPADTVVRIETSNDEVARRLIAGSRWSGNLQAGDILELKMHREEVAALSEYLIQGGVGLHLLQPRHSLEAYFLSLTTANQHVAAYPH